MQIEQDPDRTRWANNRASRGHPSPLAVVDAIRHLRAVEAQEHDGDGNCVTQPAEDVLTELAPGARGRRRARLGVEERSGDDFHSLRLGKAARFAVSETVALEWFVG